MLVPGLVAFGIYHLLKPVLPLSEPFVLLGLSGGISLLAAIWAYGQGRGCRLQESICLDGIQRWAWITGWIGFVYGIQLSLLVLAILKVFVGYDFLLHPEGPAMMALIISCTSVTRDAFEIGHVQRVMHQGTLVQTFPDGGIFRKWIPGEVAVIMKWGGMAAILGIISSWLLFYLGPLELQPMIQAVCVPVIIASIGLLSFFSGERLYAQHHHQDRKPRKLLQMVLGVAKFDILRHLFSGTSGAPGLCVPCRASDSIRLYDNRGRYGRFFNRIYAFSRLAESL